MFVWTCWWVSVSLVLIILIHYLYTYMKNALTTPIVDDAVTKNKKRYEDMFNEFQKPSSKDMSDETPVDIDTSVVITDTGANIANNMKGELQSFLRGLNDANNE